MTETITPTDAMVEAAHTAYLDEPRDRGILNSRRLIRATLTAALNHPDAAGLFADKDALRAAPTLPTEDGAVIIPAEGREFIEAVCMGRVERCREAVYEEPYFHGVWWQDGEARTNGWRPEYITPGTWQEARA